MTAPPALQTSAGEGEAEFLAIGTGPTVTSRLYVRTRPARADELAVATRPATRPATPTRRSDQVATSTSVGDSTSMSAVGASETRKPRLPPLM